MTDILSRRYRPGDRTACLAIFDSNTPPFFAPEERAEFGRFLETLERAGWPYLVLTRAGRVVACGGLIVEAEPSRASFTWGMVDRAHHGQGLGTRLTQARLALARELPGIAELVLATSQHSRGFYEGIGFTAQCLTPDGFGPGLDRWDMILRLDEA